MIGERPLSRRKKLAFTLAMLLAPIGASLLLLETGARLLIPARAPATKADLARQLGESRDVEVQVVTTGNLKGLVVPSAWPDVVYELKSSREWIFQGGRTRTNRHGFRGREHEEVKPPAARRIVGLGDSVMFGWGVDQEATFMAGLERRLANLGRPGAVEVLNFAVPGYNTMQEVALFREKCLAFSPDLVLLSYVSNDWAAPFFVRDTEGAGIVEKSVLFQRLRERLGRFSEGDYPGQGMDAVHSALDELAQLTTARGIPVVFFEYPLDLSVADTNASREIARRHGFLHVDVVEPLTRYLQRERLPPEAVHVRPGDPHPSPSAHNILAETLANAIRPLLQP